MIFSFNLGNYIIVGITIGRYVCEILQNWVNLSPNRYNYVIPAYHIISYGRTDRGTDRHTLHFIK